MENGSLIRRAPGLDTAVPILEVALRAFPARGRGLEGEDRCGKSAGGLGKLPESSIEELANLFRDLLGKSFVFFIADFWCFFLGENP